MSKSNSRIINKMKKLLAMAESKANENEAMIATRQLHALLAKHNVSISELNEDSEEINHEGELMKCRPWKRIVALHIAELYFCSFYIRKVGKGKSQYMFVGTEANRTFALHIFNMVIKVIERESRIECKKLYGKKVGSFELSFRVGAQERIVERCQELIKAAKEGSLQDEEGNTLPVMLSTYERNQLEVNEWMNKNLNLRQQKARTRADDMLGMFKGREAGSRVQLSRTIHSNSSPKLLNS